MPKVVFDIEGGKPVTAECNAGDNLLELARRANVAIDAPCSGNGSCGKCRVKLLEGTVEGLQTSHITDEDYAAGWRLSCASKVSSDVTVMVPDIASAYQSRMKTADLSTGEEVAIFTRLEEDLKAAGVDFAILRAGYRGYTEGAIQEDETFLTNLAAAKAAGLKVGAYFFSQALDKAEAVEEAEFVLNLLDGAELDYPIFFDWEDIEAEARTDGMDSVTLTACAVAFCKRVELNGYRAGVYFNQRFGFEEFDLRDLQDYELWLAEYALSPSFPYHFDVWQYANDGMLSGVDGPVDLNLAFVESRKAE